MDRDEFEEAMSDVFGRVLDSELMSLAEGGKRLWGVPKAARCEHWSSPSHIADKTHGTKSIWSVTQTQTVVVAGRATFQNVGWSAKRWH